MKIRPLGAEIHADGHTDRDMKLIVAFRHFANAPKNTLVYVLLLSFSPLFHPSLFLMFTDNSWSFYLPPPDLGACQPYIYKIVLFCEKKPRFDVRSALAVSTVHFVDFLYPLGRISEVLVWCFASQLPSFVPILCISPYVLIV